MRRFVVRFAVALITFASGIIIHSISTSPPSIESDSNRPTVSVDRILIEKQPVESPPSGALEIARRNPDGWFTLKVPRAFGEVARFADVDGGFYRFDTLEIKYDYWTEQNTPHWLSGKYATSLLLACSSKNRSTRTQRTRLDGKSAVIQQCSETDEQMGFRYVYYVTFPKLRVFDGKNFHYGMFNFTVKYRSPHHSAIAKRIVSSLDFQQ